MSDEAKDLYVSSVEGHLVTRHGTGLLIGASRDPKKPHEITWDTALVVKIPEAELVPYGREYARALREESLTPRTKEDFEAWVKAQAEATEKALVDEKAKAADAEAKAKAEADAKSRAETPTAREVKPKTGPARGAGEAKE
jgi:hypothetical protein